MASPSVNAIQPVLTCNPAHGLTGNQFIKILNCFALPTPGHNGDFIFPYIHWPRLRQQRLASVFKDFHFGESEEVAVPCIGL